MFNFEYDSWVRQWKECSSAVVPDTLMGALKECSALSYYHVHTLLILALTLPITSCESNRSFSQLKLIKTARRATMSESRLRSLAIGEKGLGFITFVQDGQLEGTVINLNYNAAVV